MPYVIIIITSYVNLPASNLYNIDIYEDNKKYLEKKSKLQIMQKEKKYLNAYFINEFINNKDKVNHLLIDKNDDILSIFIFFIGCIIHGYRSITTIP